MEPDGLVPRPVVHRLESDQRQLLVDGELGEAGVLDAVRPAPEGLPAPEGGDVLVLRLEQQDHVGPLEDLLPGGDPGDERREVGVGVAELLAVPLLQGDPGGQVRLEAGQVVGVQGEAVLVLLGRPAQDPEAEQAHRFFVGWIVSESVSE